MEITKKKIYLSLLQFDPSQHELLSRISKTIAMSCAPSHGRHNLYRELEFYAGRAAIAALLKAVGIHGCVRVNPLHGYLQLCKTDGNGGLAYLNISHTAQIAVAVLSPAPVGVDDENGNRIIQKILPRFTTSNERKNIRPIRIQNNLFPGEIALWCAKEAMSKALGLGIKFGLDRFQVDNGGDPPWSINTTLTGPQLLEQPTVLFHGYENYLIAVCSERWELHRGIEVLRVEASSLQNTLLSKRAPGRKKQS